MNSLATLQPMSKETNIPLQVLQQLQAHEFIVKSGQRQYRQIKTKNVFWTRSPLLLNRHEVRTLNRRILTEKGYYKPI